MTKNREIKISKFLSFVLRHKPESIGLTLDKNGWASVAEILKNSRGRFSTKLMHQEGYQFYISDNQIYLVEQVPANYLIVI
jgi:RNA:NAD 2'-phosphotransferase (TPT1/KptA family)